MSSPITCTDNLDVAWYMLYQFYNYEGIAVYEATVPPDGNDTIHKTIPIVKFDHEIINNGLAISINSYTGQKSHYKLMMPLFVHVDPVDWSEERPDLCKRQLIKIHSSAPSESGAYNYFILKRIWYK